MAEPVEPPSPSPLRRTFSRVIDIALWAAVLGVLVLAVLPKKSGPNVGQPATEMSLPVVGTENQTVTIPGNGERPMLIEAFASWCGACRRNAGLLSDLSAARDEGRLDVVAVSVDDHPSQALSAKKKWPIPVDVLHDAEGKFSRNYRVDVLPTYILIGTDGKVKRVTSGSPGASDIRAWLSAEE